VPRGFARRRGGEDGGAAGWIYADLFLALMIVGLGSAVVTTAGAEGTKPPVEPLVSTFRLSCEEFLIPLPYRLVNRGKVAIGQTIDAAVAQELAKRGWETDQGKPGLVIVAGGVSSNETAGDGDRRAQRLSPTIRNSSELLKSVEIRTIGAPAVGVNGVRTSIGSAGNYGLIVYLVYSGGELLENCAQ